MDVLESSREILQEAIAKYQPYAIVSMTSGGNDSLCAYYVTRHLGVTPTHILHGRTGTGIPETTDFVRRWAIGEGIDYIEADAGAAFEDYVLRKGFFGKGRTAHTYAYHLIKRGPFSACLSANIRQRKRGRNILLINGARIEESANRRSNMTSPFRVDPSTKSNIWVNVIHHWDKNQRDAFLQERHAPQNPVTKELCRSGECMCGTMQSLQARTEAAALFPQWGEWLDDLEARVRAAGFPWGWGEGVPQGWQDEKKGQLPLFQPMCVSCKLEGDD
jgi:3'-phosphoadenosine 5'-phosphosulfate sulfotransferase (PAPS reductase)/FAD synthetase